MAGMTSPSNHTTVNKEQDEVYRSPPTRRTGDTGMPRPLRVPRVHTPRETYVETFSCPLCDRTGLPKGSRCPCQIRVVASPDLRALRTRYVEGRAWRAADDAERLLKAKERVYPAAPMCAWCHERPPVDTGGLCRHCCGDEPP